MMDVTSVVLKICHSQEHIFLVIAVSFLCCLLYWLLPFHTTKSTENLGYNDILKCGANEIQQHTALRRTRNAGNVPPVYPNGWYCLAESSEIPVGRAKYIPALGENFVVFRGKTGQAYVLDAYCPHLGANLGIGSRVIENCVECPFHGWRFNGEDGKCSLIPYSEKIPKSAGVQKWQSQEVNGCILVWYHAEGEDPSWHPPDLLSERYLIYRGREDLFINMHLQDMHENAADAKHFDYLHAAPPFLNTFARKYFEDGVCQFIKHSFDVRWESCIEPGKGHIAALKVHHSLCLFGKWNIFGLEVTVTEIGPGMVELVIKSLVGRVLISITVTPIQPLTLKAVFRYYFSPLCLPLSGLFIGFQRFVFGEDTMVLNHKKFIDTPILVKQEESIAKFRRWFSQFYSVNSPTLDHEKKSIQW